MDLRPGFSTARLFQATIRRIQNRTILQIFTPVIIARIAYDRRLSLGTLLVKAPKMVPCGLESDRRGSTISLRSALPSRALDPDEGRPAACSPRPEAARERRKLILPTQRRERKLASVIRRVLILQRHATKVAARA